MFSLNMRNSYISFNDPTATDKQAEMNIEIVANGLFSVFATLGLNFKFDFCLTVAFKLEF